LSHLVTDAPGAVPITPVMAGDGLESRMAALDDRARAWVKATGFAAEAGKWTLLPDAAGGLARVLVGGASGDELWALAGLPDSLPEGVYRIDPEPEPALATRMALGWALGCYAFTRYRPRKRGFAHLAWPRGADRGLVERLARGIGLARDLINTPAEDLGPAELAGAVEELAARATARAVGASGQSRAAGYSSARYSPIASDSQTTSSPCRKAGTLPDGERRRMLGRVAAWSSAIISSVKATPVCFSMSQPRSDQEE